MISPGRVSVIIPCYNYSDYLALSLRSVLSQSYKDWEVIIVNDGSCDSTEVVARDFAERYPSQISYFKIANSGVATARNLAIEHGTGEFILALDADDAITANALSRFVEQMRADANVAVVYSSVRFLDVPPGSPTIWNPGPILKRNLFTENFIPITSLWKRELFDSGIRYRDVLFEDWDLWVQIRARDKKFAYIPEALFEHRVHPFGRDSKNKYYYFQAVSQQALGTPKAYPQQLMEGASDVLANAPRCFELPSVVLLPSEASFEDSKRAQNWKERAELWAARGHTVYIVGSDPHGQIPQRPGVVKLGVNPQAWFGSVLYALERVGDDVIVISELESGRNLRLQRRSNVSVLVDLAESKNAFADINVIELQGGGSKVAFRDRPEETFYGSEGDLQESILTYYRNAIRTKKVQAIRQYIRHQRLARGASPDFLEKVDSYIEPLSIVIPVRNVDSRRLERCIQSIVSGDRSDSLEIVVSNFGSAPEYQEFLEYLCVNYPVRVVNSETRSPWSRARALNIGAKAASHEWLMFTDADMLFHPAFFMMWRAYSFEFGERSLYLAQCKKLPPISKLPFPWSGEFFDEVAAKGRVFDTYGQGGCQILHRRWFERLKGFNESYQVWGSEDEGLTFRARLDGLEMVWMRPGQFLHQWHVKAVPSQVQESNAEKLKDLKDNPVLVVNDDSWGTVSEDEGREFRDLGPLAENLSDDLKLARQFERSILSSNLSQKRVVDMLFEWGSSALAARHVETARETFEDLLNLDPENLSAIIGLARCFIFANGYIEASHLAAFVLDKDPNNLLARDILNFISTQQELAHS